MKVTHLHDGWTFSAEVPDIGYERPHAHALGTLPATVPGCVHLDLMANGVIADPFVRMQEFGCQWVDETDWVYELRFDWRPSFGHQLLRFDGLDTVAELFLNDVQIGESDNHFVPIECEVTGVLRVGNNVLRVRLRSAVKVGMSRREAYCMQEGTDPATVFFDERAFVRKPAYAFGWDWGPRLVGAGIFAPLSLIEFDSRIESFDVMVTPLDSGVFRVSASAVSSGGDLSLSLDLFEDAKIISGGSDGASAEWIVSGGLWWPNGMGEQTLHRVTCELRGSEGVIESRTRRIGLRNVEFLREKESHAESFEFRINDQKIFACGANWIPSDSFLARVTDEKIEAQVALAASLGMNMLRVWGGGQYESEAFYDACDRHGILVWQDFPYACSYYPDDAPSLEAAKNEAEHHVKRLRHRASLALWCGNNENLLMWQTKWGDGVQPERFIGERIFDEVLANVVAEFSPGTPYIASSPIGMSPDESVPVGTGRNANQDHFGDSHYWDVWHGRGDWVHYRQSLTNFSSEFGFASAASLATYRDCLSPEEISEFPSKAFLHHDKTKKPWKTFTSLVELHYPPAKSLDDWIYYSQLNQRDALRCGIEHYRANPNCRGTLIWQFNDCWPVQSWAVQDSLGFLKPAGFELRRLYDDLLITTDYEPGDPVLRISVVNDGAVDYSGSLSVEFMNTLSSEFIESHELPVFVPAGSSAVVAKLPLPFENDSTAVELSLDRERPRWVLLADPKDMQLPLPVLTYRVADELVVETDEFVADLVVWDKDDLSAVQSQGMGQPGWDPVTVPLGPIRYSLAGPVRRLRARSLAGEHEIRPV